MGDQFALMEAVIALAVALRRFSFRMVPGHDPGMTTGDDRARQHPSGHQIWGACGGTWCWLPHARPCLCPGRLHGTAVRRYAPAPAVCIKASSCQTQRFACCAGATIHTLNGLYMYITQRNGAAAPAEGLEAVAAA